MRIRRPVLNLRRKSYNAESIPSKKDVLDCALGCNSFGTSSRVVKIGEQYDWSQLHRTPDTSYSALKELICQFWSNHNNLTIENIKVANGSSVFLSRLNKLFIEHGVRVAGYVPQFQEYMIEVQVLGGIFEAVSLQPSENFKFNPFRFTAQFKQKTGIAYLDNPNNPTGQVISLSDIESIASEAAKRDITLIVDEAYGEYVGEDCSAINLFKKFRNLIITRTFSKGYGIGQFRVGYGIMPADLGVYYERIEQPFSVSQMGASLAKEALKDQNFILNTRRQVREVKHKLVWELGQRGYFIAETDENCPIFVMGSQDENIDLKTFLLNKGILTTSGNDWPELRRNYVRVNTPTSAEAFLERLDS